MAFPEAAALQAVLAPPSPTRANVVDPDRKRQVAPLVANEDASSLAVGRPQPTNLVDQVRALPEGQATVSIWDVLSVHHPPHTLGQRWPSDLVRARPNPDDEANAGQEFQVVG